MKKQLRRVATFAISLVLTAVIYFAAVENNSLAWNFATFFSWLLFVLHAIMFVALLAGSPSQALLKSYRDGKHLSAWLDRIFYWAKMLMFVYSGSYLYAAMWFVIYYSDFSYRATSEKQEVVP